MTTKITKADLEHVRRLFERLGQTADSVTEASEKITTALPDEAELKRARRSLRTAAAASWMWLLGRLFGR
jgi:hypothetical protein